MCVAAGNISAATLSNTEIDVFLDLTTADSFYHKAPLIKWQKPINLGVYGHPTASDALEIRNICSEINETLKGRLISLQEEPANLFVYFLSIKQFRNLAGIGRLPGRSFVRLFSNDNFEIDSCVVFIADELIEIEKRAAIRTSITQALGFTGTAEIMKHTSFGKSLTAYFPQYSKLEKSYINLLFNADLRSGMSRKELKELLKSMK